MRRVVTREKGVKSDERTVPQLKRLSTAKCISERRWCNVTCALRLIDSLSAVIRAPKPHAGGKEVVRTEVERTWKAKEDVICR